MGWIQGRRGRVEQDHRIDTAGDGEDYGPWRLTRVLGAKDVAHELLDARHNRSPGIMSAEATIGSDKIGSDTSVGHRRLPRHLPRRVWRSVSRRDGGGFVRATHRIKLRRSPPPGIV